jgi:hypothetical protein
MRSAVLFLVFNRPETTKKVFAAIRAAKPPKLYIAADGPRSDRPSDKEACEEVRAIATAVDWPCEVKTLFREHNLGCKIGVSTGINWFFENEEEGIILEDDVLPLPSFFPYCDELLAKYRDNDRVWMISGSNLISDQIDPQTSYFFSRNALIWGWASWRRAWQHYDVHLQDWPKLKQEEWLGRVFANQPLLISHWTYLFNELYAGKRNTWDYQCAYTCWRIGALTITPAENLTENLGFGENATHTSSQKPAFLDRALPKNLIFPLRHPNEVVVNESADALVFKQVHGISLKNAIKRLIKSLIQKPLASFRK